MTIASLLDKKTPVIPTLPSPSTFPPPISLSSAPPVTSTSVPVVPSLFSSVYQASTVNQQQQLPTSNSQLSESNPLTKMTTNLTASAPTMIGNQTSVSISPFTTVMSTNLTAVAAAPAMMNNQPNASTPSSSFSFTTTSSVSSLSQPFLPTSSLPTASSTTAPTLPPSQPMQNLGFQSRLPATSTVGNLSSLSLPTQPLGQTLSSSSLPSAMTQNFTSLGTSGMQQQLNSLGLGNLNTTAASASTTLSTTTSSSGTLSAATSPVGGGPNTTNPLIQLVQMYKHFQSQGDSQGMMRVRQQLNILVARQKIINAQNSLRAASALSSAQSSTVNLPAASSSNASTTVQNVNTRLNQSQNPTSSVGSGQMPQVLQQSGQSAQQQQPQQPSGALPNFSTAFSTLPTRPSAPKPPQMPVTVSQVPPSILSASHPSLSATAGSSSLPQANTMPSGMSIGPSTTVSQTPFNTPPTSALATKVPTTSTNMSQQQPPVGAIASQSLQQQIVKRLQTVIASLPESQRPKTIPELKDFVQKYSSLITQNSLLDLSVPGSAGSAGSQMAKSTATITTAGLASTSTPRPGPSSVASGTRLSQTGSIPSLLNSTAPMANSGAKLSLLPPPSAAGSVAPPPPAPVTATSAHINSATTQSPSAQVAEHFKSSLAGLAVSKAPMGPTVGAAVSSVLASSASNNPLPIGLMVPGRVGVSVPSTVHAPVTTQFAQKVGTVNSALPPVSQTSKPPATVVAAVTTSQAPSIAPPTSSASTATSTSGGSGIQPGVATPLPPGLTLETLSVLCRLPETDLLKLKLPPALLSAIKVWKARQPPSKSAARVSIL